jgi:hypothetical protein
MTISKSPDRHTFQQQGYIKRQEEQGLEPLEEYIEMFKTWRQQDEENMVDPKWQKDNLEYDLRSTPWILEKVRGDDVYAQHLYAAMCNNDFQKLDTWPILKGETWSCSWRHAGGIVADMQQKGDYIDWYCSGIQKNNNEYTEEWSSTSTEEEIKHAKQQQAFVPEKTVTDEIAEDLQRLGWAVVDSNDEF